MGDRLSGLRSKPCQAHPKIRRAHGVGGRAQACDGAWCSVAAEGVRSSPRAGGGAVESSKAGAAFTFVPDDDDDDDDDWDRVTGS